MDSASTGGAVQGAGELLIAGDEFSDFGGIPALLGLGGAQAFFQAGDLGLGGDEQGLEAAAFSGQPEGTDGREDAGRCLRRRCGALDGQAQDGVLPACGRSGRSG